MVAGAVCLSMDYASIDQSIDSDINHSTSPTNPPADAAILGQCRPRQLCPYHHGEEIWYADEMPSLLPTDAPAGDTQLFVSCPGDEVGRRRRHRI